jgi:putative transposase
MYFTKQYTKNIQSDITLTSSRFFKREKTIWLRRFWEHRIRNEQDLHQHFDYIHFNPVKHGYVNNPKDWKWSTFHRFVEKDWYDCEWGSSEPKNIIEFCVGE